MMSTTTDNQTTPAGASTERLVSRKAAADLLGVSVFTLDRLRKSGAVSAVPIRGRVLFRRSDIASIQRNGVAEAV